MSQSQQSDHAYRAFVHELAQDPARSALLARLRTGHQPDRDGWCIHAAHAHRWERHPCSILQFVDLVEDDSAATGTPVPETPERRPGPPAPR